MKPRPKARIKLGHHFMGVKTSTTAEGYALYKEWDPEDNKHYYWEEWELRGFNDIDSWIEYDHYTKLVTHYEPIRHVQKVDPRGLTKDQIVTFQDGAVLRNLRVKEAGKGILARREGTFSYHIFEGETMEYADLVDIENPTNRFSAERYNDVEYDIYRSTVLSKREQKSLLGKVVAPFNWGAIVQALFWVLFGGFFLYSEFAPRSETTCTPRTVSSNSSTVQQSASSSSLSSSSQDCQTRTVYGFGSGGSGGGVGK